MPWIIQYIEESISELKKSNNYIINDEIAEIVYRKFCQQKILDKNLSVTVRKYFSLDKDLFESDGVLYKERILSTNGVTN